MLKQFVFKLSFNDVEVFMDRNSAGFKSTFYLKKMIFGRKKYVSSAFKFTERFAHFTL